MRDEQRPARTAGAARAGDPPRRPTRAAARQLDTFAERDVRGTARQLQLPDPSAAGEATHGAQ